MYPSVKLFQVSSGIRGTLEKMHKRIDQILENIVHEHRERKRITESGKGEEEDLVDVLLRIQKHGDLEFPSTDNNIKAVILDIFSAGSETSSTIIDWAVSEMLKNPQVMKRAQAEVRSVIDKKGNVDETCLHELEPLNLVIKETLRLHPSAPLLVPRESSEQGTINGYLPRPKSLSMLGQSAQTPNIGMKQRNLIPRDFLTVKLISRGEILSSFRLVLEGGYAPGNRLLFLILSFHLHNCCIILIGNSLMERSMKN
ncbi:hypothetical protein ACSBR1_011316 [Camellia fascicularis]